MSNSRELDLYHFSRVCFLLLLKCWKESPVQSLWEMVVEVEILDA